MVILSLAAKKKHLKRCIANAASARKAIFSDILVSKKREKNFAIFRFLRKIFASLSLLKFSFASLRFRLKFLENFRFRFSFSAKIQTPGCNSTLKKEYWIKAHYFPKTSETFINFINKETYN